MAGLLTLIFIITLFITTLPFYIISQIFSVLYFSSILLFTFLPPFTFTLLLTPSLLLFSFYITFIITSFFFPLPSLLILLSNTLFSPIFRTYWLLQLTYYSLKLFFLTNLLILELLFLTNSLLLELFFLTNSLLLELFFLTNVLASWTLLLN